MRTENGHVHLDEEEASGGSKEGVVRWVLLGGLLLAIVLLSITWIVPALLKEKGEGDGQGTETTRVEANAPAADPNQPAEAVEAVPAEPQDGGPIPAN